MNRGIFFDLDGTLADNLDVMFAVYERFLNNVGRSATRQEFDMLNGPPLPEIVVRLKKKHGLAGSETDLLSSYRNILDELYSGARPAPGAHDVLKTAAATGWMVGVVTSNSRRRAGTWLQNNALARFVNFIVSGDDCGEWKPSPAPYMMAMEKGQCSAEQSYAVEDSLAGVQSAVAAGIRTFCYMNGRNSGVPFPSNVHTLHHFDDLVALIKNGRDVIQ